jgi:hypothetical protein
MDPHGTTVPPDPHPVAQAQRQLENYFKDKRWTENTHAHTLQDVSVMLADCHMPYIPNFSSRPDVELSNFIRHTILALDTITYLDSTYMSNIIQWVKYIKPDNFFFRQGEDAFQYAEAFIYQVLSPDHYDQLFSILIATLETNTRLEQKIVDMQETENTIINAQLDAHQINSMLETVQRQLTNIATIAARIAQP